MMPVRRNGVLPEACGGAWGMWLTEMENLRDGCDPPESRRSDDEFVPALLLEVCPIHLRLA